MGQKNICVARRRGGPRDTITDSLLFCKVVQIKFARSELKLYPAARRPGRRSALLLYSCFYRSLFSARSLHGVNETCVRAVIERSTIFRNIKKFTFHLWDPRREALHQGLNT